MIYKHELTHEDDRWEHGRTYVQMVDSGPWEFTSAYIRSKQTLWFGQRPHEILATLGIVTDDRRAKEFADLCDGDLDGFYYVAAASDGTDEAIKWIMGSLAAVLNERSLPLSKVGSILPADYLRTFVEYLKTGKFEKSFAKDVFAALLAAPTHACTTHFPGYASQPHAPETARDWSRRDPVAALDQIIADPRFKASDSSEIAALVDEIIAANPDNAAKAKEQPKLVQWFLGQVLKASKGKAAPQVVKELLEQRLM